MFYIFIGVIILLNGCGSKPLTYSKLKAQYSVDKSKTKAHRNANGQLDGVYEEYYKMGKLAFTCTYVNGKRHGVAKGYGSYYTQIDYNVDKAYGRTPTSAANLSYFKTSESNYVNGKKEGYETYFWSDGSKRGQTLYVNGVDIEHAAGGKEIAKKMRKLDKKLAACRKGVSRGEHDYTRCKYIESAMKNLSASAYQLGH